MEFAKFVKEIREKRFKNPREFWRVKKLSFSYFTYLKVESGQGLPELKIAMEILEALEANMRNGLYTWVRDHMPTPETKAMFVEFGTEPVRSSRQTSPEKSLVISRIHKKLLEKHEIYWEIITYLSLYHGLACPNSKMIATAFNKPVRDIRGYLNELYEYGLIERKSNDEYFTKEWIFIPYEEEFKSLRDKNFSLAVRKFLKSKDENKFRTTLTRPLTKKQRQELDALVLAFSNSIVDIGSIDDLNDFEPYTVGIFCSKRGFGDV